MKQLIESMITGYLEESYEDDNIVESIFEEVSEETWEAIEEAILNELSPSLLARYSDKAKERAKKYREREQEFGDAKKGNLDHIRGQNSDPYNSSDRQKKILSKYGSLEKKYKDKANRREKGSKKAFDKMYNSWQDYRKMPSDEFEKKYRMTKAEFNRKNS
jgi:hypothetical protein